jgi:4-hydroxy-tetrahydrodipicolinate synthase
MVIFTPLERHIYRCFDLTNLLFAEGNPAGIKALLELRGVCGSTVRLPLVSASPSLKEQLLTALSALEI